LPCIPGCPVPNPLVAGDAAKLRRERAKAFAYFLGIMTVCGALKLLERQCRSGNPENCDFRSGHTAFGVADWSLGAALRLFKARNGRFSAKNAARGLKRPSAC
jgi:membrane-associated phospholipid phosphatase